MSEELKLLPCPFCGSHDVEVQGKPAILDALDSVCCNECTADAPYPVWNNRAELAAIKAGRGDAVASALKELAKQFLEAWPDHTGKYYFLLGAGLEIAKAAPPATGDATSVERELLLRIAFPATTSDKNDAIAELRAVLAQSHGVKS